MKSARARTVGKTPTMAFVIDYLRQFPGAEYKRVKAAAQTFGVGFPATIVYGNALRVLKKEAEPGRPATASPSHGYIASALVYAKVDTSRVRAALA